jgi:hypothetical protein
MFTSRIGASGLIAATLCLSAPISLASASPGDEPVPADTKQLEAWWADMEKGETPATRAVLNLADRPQDAVNFLKTKLKPLAISPERVKALLFKLGHHNEAVWKPAFEELEYFDPRLAIDLETLMNRYKENPARHRLVELLSGQDADSMKDYQDLEIRAVDSGFNFTGKMEKGVLSWWAERRVDRIGLNGWGVDPKKKWTRAVRAIVLLEHLHTPEAITILKSMAGGHPDAYPTKSAQQSLAAIGANSAATRVPPPGKRR